jgi:hypothetical protein
VAAARRPITTRHHLPALPPRLRGPSPARQATWGARVDGRPVTDACGSPAPRPSIPIRSCPHPGGGRSAGQGAALSARRVQVPHRSVLITEPTHRAADAASRTHATWRTRLHNLPSPRHLPRPRPWPSGRSCERVSHRQQRGRDRRFRREELRLDTRRLTRDRPLRRITTLRPVDGSSSQYSNTVTAYASDGFHGVHRRARPDLRGCGCLPKSG